MRTDTDAGTRGRFARLTAGAETIEIKATILQAHIRTALEHYGLTRINDELRLIYFFDTPDLVLQSAGIIARARRVIGDQHDSTIKFRPVQPESVARRWRKYRDFKIEVDASERGLVKSASLSMPVARGQIKRVVAGKKNIRSLFTEEQEDFLDEMANTRIDFRKIVTMGPLRAQRWDFEDPACPWPITAELWEREDKSTMMEVSVKALVGQAAAVMAGFMAFLAEVGVQRDASPQAKTRWALEHYAARHVPRSSPRATRGPVRKASRKISRRE
jgi:hypothetical protein